MKANVILKKEKWFSKSGKIDVKGYIIKNGQRIDKGSLVAYFEDANSFSSFKELLQLANGQFSIIIQKENEIWIGVDRFRNYPIFYTQQGDFYTISDSTIRYNNFEIDKNALSSFLYSGFVANEYTLIKNVFQVEAGQAIIVKENTITKDFYFNYLGQKNPYSDKKAASLGLKNILESVFIDYVSAFSKDCTFVLPLSGGYDSRLIACMLKENGIENVICFTYGRSGNDEFANAEKVAKQLNYQWIKIEYDALIHDYFLSDSTFKEYYPYASNDVSMFYLQDYFAMKYLTDNKLLPKNAIFVPGHTGDVLAGGHLKPNLNSKFHLKKWSKIIKNTNFNFLSESNHNLDDFIEKKLTHKSIYPWTLFENWEQKERQAKFVINSAKVFNFFGYDYILPLWDNRLVDFFQDLPFEWKEHKMLYAMTLKTYFFSKLNVNYEKELQATPFHKLKQSIKEHIKKLLPKHYVHKFTQNDDWYCYKEVVEQMKIQKGGNAFLTPSQLSLYNAYLTQWYVLEEFGIELK